MENIYEISSKPAHTELKKGGLKFEMNPDKEDALRLTVLIVLS
jgi:hypothetical protein